MTDLDAYLYRTRGETPSSFQHLRLDEDETLCGRRIELDLDPVLEPVAEGHTFDPSMAPCRSCERELARLRQRVAADRTARPAQYRPLP